MLVRLLNIETLENKQELSKMLARSLGKVTRLKKELQTMEDHNESGHVFQWTQEELKAQVDKIEKAEEIAQKLFYKVVE